MSEELMEFLKQLNAQVEQQYFKNATIPHLVKISIECNPINHNVLGEDDLNELFELLNDSSIYYTVNIKFKNHNLPE